VNRFKLTVAYREPQATHPGAVILQAANAKEGRNIEVLSDDGLLDPLDLASALRLLAEGVVHQHTKKDEAA
jgi:hypothetical protein